MNDSCYLGLQDQTKKIHTHAADGFNNIDATGGGRLKAAPLLVLPIALEYMGMVLDVPCLAVEAKTNSKIYSPAWTLVPMAASFLLIWGLGAEYVWGLPSREAVGFVGLNVFYQPPYIWFIC